MSIYGPLRTETYSVKELSKVLGWCQRTTYQSLRDGTIPAHNTGGRWIISRQRIHNWINGKEV